MSRRAVRLWAGRSLSGLVVLFILFDGVTKILHVAPVVEATARLGMPEGSLTGIRALAFLNTALYAVPRTALLGASLLTAFLGGAVATHVRVGDPLIHTLFLHTLFPVYLGVFAWCGLALRKPQVGQLFRSWPPRAERNG